MTSVDMKTEMGSVGATNVKHTLKYLAVCTHPRVFKSVIKDATDSVIKAICNAAYNVERGEIHLKPAQKKFLANYRSEIALLTSQKAKLPRKRRVLVRRGAEFVPALIRIVSEQLGSLLAIVQESDD